MKKRFMPTVVAFIILVILVIYANYFETEEILLPGAQKPVQIVDLSQDAVQSITWLGNEDKNLKLIFEKDKAPMIAAPSSYRADKSEAEGVLRHFVELKSEMVVSENSADFEQYGINASSTKVIISGVKGDIELSIGSKSEVGGSYYLTKKGENKVYLVAGYIKGTFATKSLKICGISDFLPSHLLILPKFLMKMAMIKLSLKILHQIQPNGKWLNPSHTMPITF